MDSTTKQILENQEVILLALSTLMIRKVLGKDYIKRLYRK